MWWWKQKRTRCQYLYHMKRDYHTIVLIGKVCVKKGRKNTLMIQAMFEWWNKSFLHDVENAFGASGSFILVSQPKKFILQAIKSASNLHH